MLLEEPQALESYIVKTKDKELRKWWAQYMESTGEIVSVCARLQFHTSPKWVCASVGVISRLPFESYLYLTEFY